MLLSHWTLINGCLHKRGTVSVKNKMLNNSILASHRLKHTCQSYSGGILGGKKTTSAKNCVQIVPWNTTQPTPNDDSIWNLSIYPISMYVSPEFSHSN